MTHASDAPSDTSGAKNDNDFELSPEVPKMYVNVFGVAMGRSDIVVVARHNDADLAAISMSYTTAKSLAQSLGQVIAYLEAKTGTTIMTIEDIDQKLSEPPPESESS